MERVDAQVALVVAAWLRWDALPGDRRRANELEDACQALAREVGVGCSVLRHQVAAKLREGCGHHQAVEYVVLSLSTPSCGNVG